MVTMRPQPPGAPQISDAFLERAMVNYVQAIRRNSAARDRGAPHHVSDAIDILLEADTHALRGADGATHSRHIAAIQALQDTYYSRAVTRPATMAEAVDGYISVVMASLLAGDLTSEKADMLIAHARRLA